jgi:hypothetical protein
MPPPRGGARRSPDTVRAKSYTFLSPAKLAFVVLDNRSWRLGENLEAEEQQFAGDHVI